MLGRLRPPVTETPALSNPTYEDWQTGQLREILAALTRATPA